jgi:nucleoid DNA-binding protein
MAKAAKSAGKSGGKKAMTKSALIAHLAEASTKAGHETSKKEVDTILNALVATVVSEVKSAGKIVIPGLARVTVTHKPAQPGGEKKINRLNGQEYVTKPKPAQTVVKLRAVKALKEAVNTKK